MTILQWVRCMETLKNTKLCVFDAYGTLFDINSVTKQYCNELEEISDQFSNLWRSKQLEYTWLRSLMNRYEDFWCITEESLDYTLKYFNIKNDFLKSNLLKSYENINCYEEVPKTLFKLKEILPFESDVELKSLMDLTNII